MQNEEDIASLPFMIIVGSPRSGTTMLRTMFDAHSEVQIPTEYPFIPFYYPFFKTRLFNSQDIDLFLKLIKKNFKYNFWTTARWRMDYDMLKNDMKNDRFLNFNRAVKYTIAHFNSVFPKKKLSLLMQKEPFYSYSLKSLKKIFPELKVIALYRDPRGQVNSIIRKRFGSRLISANAFAWKIAQKRIFSFEKKFSDDILKVRYEDMITDTRTVVEKVCKFAGISFEEGMLDYQNRKEDIFNAYKTKKDIEFSDVRSTLKKPDPKKINEWESGLDKKDIKLIEVINMKIMKKYNYIPKYDRNIIYIIAYIPVYIHFILQNLIAIVIKLLPPMIRLKIIALPSLFEGTYGRLFGKRFRK